MSDPADTGPGARAMPGRQRGRPTFFGAPWSVAALAAATLEPLVCVLSLYGLHRLQGVSFGRWAVAGSLMIIALTFPGRYPVELSAWQAAALTLRNGLQLLGLMLLCVYVTGGLRELDWALVLPWALLMPLLHWAARLGLRQWLRWHARGRAGARTAVIVGGGALAERTAQALLRDAQGALRLVGFFDDRGDERLGGSSRLPRLGQLAEVGRFVAKLGIREVYICLPVASQPRLLAMMDALQTSTAAIYFVPDVFGVQIVQGRLKDIGGLAVVGVCESPFTGIDGLGKRLSDVVLALAALAWLWPLMAVIVLRLALAGAGPVLGRHRCTGLDGHEIIVHRFHARPGGRLARSGLDCLPQLVDVLWGRLSLVGPQALPVGETAHYQQTVPAFMVRHKARPGMVGWAQLQRPGGDRGAGLPVHERLALDLEYLRHWSLALDLHILQRSLLQRLQRWIERPGAGAPGS